MRREFVSSRGLAGWVTGTGPELLGDPADVGGDVGGRQVRPVVLDGHVHLREPELADRPQRGRQRLFPETERGTGNEHGNLRRVLRDYR